MPLSTRDYQRARRQSRLAIEALTAITEELEFSDADNVSYGQTASSDILSPRPSSQSTVASTILKMIDDRAIHKNTSVSQTSGTYRYFWRMRHYFYIHLKFPSIILMNIFSIINFKLQRCCQGNYFIINFQDEEVDRKRGVSV